VAQAEAEAKLEAEKTHAAEQARADARMRVAQAPAAPAAAAAPPGEPVHGGHLLSTDSALGGVVKVDGCAAARALLNACHSGAQFHSVIMFAGRDLDEGELSTAKWTWQGGAIGRWLVDAGANQYRVETHIFNKTQVKYERRASMTTLEDCTSSTFLVVRRHAPPSFGGRGLAFVLADAQTLAASLLPSSGAKPSSLPQVHQPLAARVGLLRIGQDDQWGVIHAVRRLSGNQAGAAPLGQNASLSNRFVRSKAEHEMSQACNGKGAQGERFGDVSGWQGGEYKAELSAASLGIAHVCTNETCFARLSTIRESPAAREGGFISTTSPLSRASAVRLWWSPLSPGEALRKRGVGPMALEKVHIGNIVQGSALAQYIARHGHVVSGLTEPQYKARMVELGFSNLFPEG